MKNDAFADALRKEAANILELLERRADPTKPKTGIRAFSKYLIAAGTLREIVERLKAAGKVEEDRISDGVIGLVRAKTGKLTATSLALVKGARPSRTRDKIPPEGGPSPRSRRRVPRRNADK